MNYVFFGSDEFSEIVLGILKKSGFRPAFIVNKENFIKEKLAEEFAKLKPDLFIIASFGKILPKEFIYLPKKGTLNIHPSLLPEFRGPSPIQTALLEGRKKTGVTIILTDEKIDNGPILVQEEIEIKKEDNYESLKKKLGEKGGELLVKIIPLWFEEKIKLKEQNHSLMTFTRLLKKEDGKIDWSQDSEKISNQIKALNPWPSAYTFWLNEKGNQKRLIILSAKPKLLISQVNNSKPGNIIFENNSLLVKTNDGFLELLEVKPESKKPMSGEAFWRGHQSTLIFIF